MIHESAPLLIASVALALSGVSVALSALSWRRRGGAAPGADDELRARVDALEEATARFVIEDGRGMSLEERDELAQHVLDKQKELCSIIGGKMSPKEAMREARRLFNLPP